LSPWEQIKGTDWTGNVVLLLLVCFADADHLYLTVCRPSRGERSGRYGSLGGREESDRYESRKRDTERDSDRRWGDEQECFEERRDSPEVGGFTTLCNTFVQYL
jgi:hypothetical protein